MTLSRSVFEDLYALYQAGEAGAETRRLVESYLNEHPEVRRTGASHAETTMSLDPAMETALPAIEVPAEVAGRSYRLTQGLLARRQWLLAAGLVLSLLPGVALPEDGQLGLPLFAAYPVVAGLLFAGALVTWVFFIRVCRRLRATGLAPSSSWLARLTWGLGGLAAGTAPHAAIQYWTGWNAPPLYLITGTMALWLGMRSGQIAEDAAAEWARPRTLFGPQRPVD